MSAVRLERGATGRSTIIKFAGAVADTVVVPWNVVPDIDETVAVVCVEPVAANMGLVPPRDGFLEELRAACDRAGALLLFDEVITGFRIDRGGATALFGVRPDIWCFGKVIGGGLPVGAFGASAEIMANLAPVGEVYQAGTLSGNPLATAAGLAVLSQLTPDAYVRLVGRAEILADGLTGAFAAAGVDVCVRRIGSLVGLFFGSHPPGDYDEAKASVGVGSYPVVFHAMLDQGIALAPGPYEVMFPSLAHSDDDLAATISAAHHAASVVAASRHQKDST